MYVQKFVHKRLFSGRNFNVDASRGLTGFCDFILTHNPNKLVIKAPVVVIVEAKNENINDGLAQCIASMYAAQIINQKNQEENIKAVYGSVTTGQVWRFLSMDKTQQVKVDLNERYLTPLNELVGILVAITSIPNRSTLPQRGLHTRRWTDSCHSCLYNQAHNSLHYPHNFVQIVFFWVGESKLV